MFIDSHCHLADAAFADDLDAVVARARAAGVSRAICILSADEADEVARARVVRAAWAAVDFAAGVHPHRAAAYADRPALAAEAAGRALEEAGAVALGEVGLDYHYDFAPRLVQQHVFDVQVALAAQLGLPLVIHTREAMDDTLAVLRQARPAPRGVMHCFTGTLDEARRALDLGFYLSLAGVVTFAKADALRDVARFVPDDRLLVETDAPFLAPVPNRGRRNEPAWVASTYQVLAGCRGQEVAALAAQVEANSAALFGTGSAVPKPRETTPRVDTPAKPMV